MNITSCKVEKFFNDDEQPKTMVIALHGYTRNANYMLDCLTHLGFNASETVLIAPNAPEKVPNEIIIEYNIDNIDTDQYRQWFALDDIWIDGKTYDREECYQRVNGITVDIIEFIEEQLKSYDLQYENLFLLGFSQGATVVNHIGLKMQKPCAGIISLGGFVISPELLESDISRPPILIINGADDTVVSQSFYDESVQFFESNDFDLEQHLIPDLDHFMNEKMMNYVNDFISSHI